MSVEGVLLSSYVLPDAYPHLAADIWPSQPQQLTSLPSWSRVLFNVCIAF